MNFTLTPISYTIILKVFLVLNTVNCNWGNAIGIAFLFRMFSAAHTACQIFPQVYQMGNTASFSIQNTEQLLVVF